MDRVNKILNHDLFIEYCAEIESAETERPFCRHDMAHFLDVARIAWILNLQQNLKISDELIYATALLHDIGRVIQNKQGTPHNEASAVMAPEILQVCGFAEYEIAEIVEAIREHQTIARALEENLCGIIYRADKMSRACFCCKEEKQCDWNKNKKNFRLVR